MSACALQYSPPHHMGLVLISNHWGLAILQRRVETVIGKDMQQHHAFTFCPRNFTWKVGNIESVLQNIHNSKHLFFRNSGSDCSFGSSGVIIPQFGHRSACSTFSWLIIIAADQSSSCWGGNLNWRNCNISNIWPTSQQYIFLILGCRPGDQLLSCEVIPMDRPFYQGRVLGVLF